ncbi:MAG: F0F1 ATP synthase subunit delta [Candidatus Dormibacteraeota bacterium]|nr:F0F1 ATP synthase subunit delta [Candidatus Dormibacteraeota bacterium]
MIVRASPVARRYAEAYFGLAREAEDIAGWRAELADVTEVLSDPKVAGTLQNPRLNLTHRVKIGLELLEGVSEQARNLARLLIERQRAGHIREVLAAYDELADRASGVLRAEVVTAVPVDAKVTEQITSVLSRRFGQSVHPVIRQDPAIIGGLVVRIGDRVIDDSIRTHLQQLQASLA